MSRIAKAPIVLPDGVSFDLTDCVLTIKGPKGQLNLKIREEVSVSVEDNQMRVKPTLSTKFSHALSGTVSALIRNMIIGVTKGFEKKLLLVGTGYRAQAQGAVLNLALGFSHPVVVTMPEGISVATPSQSEIIITGSDKQRVGKVAAEIRAYRAPEPYKGKGVRYSDEVLVLKEVKKK